VRVDVGLLPHTSDLTNYTPGRRQAIRQDQRGDRGGAGRHPAIRELVRIEKLLAKIQEALKGPGGTTVNVVY
jgi:hypothetical protein